MKTIPLSQGFVALVDDEDFERVNQFKWSVLIHDKGYHIRRYAVRQVDGRPAGQSLNGANRRKCAGTSRFKGVSWNTGMRAWVAQIKKDGKPRWLGCFKDEVDAATAYNFAAEEMFGDFAILNRPLVVA